jgi:crossover junction endodeoxyribonuclease RuvC
LRSHALWHHCVVSITAQQFQQLQDRVARRTPKPAIEHAPSTRVEHKIVLGIDPSLRGTGYGVIRNASRTPELLAQGTVKCAASLTRVQCLARIAETVRKVIRDCSPTVCIVEGLFFAQNLQTALIMGEARGASLVAAAEAGLEVYEIAPRKVKQAVVGYGAAQKLAVAKMVQRMLRLAELPAPDAADALALALTYAQESRSPIARVSRKL